MTGSWRKSHASFRRVCDPPEADFVFSACPRPIFRAVRWLGCGFAVLTVLLFCLSCRPRSAPVTVSFMVFGEPAEVAAYEQLVAAFEAQYPAIDVQLSHVPSQSDYQQRLVAAFSAGNPPDVMLLNYRRYAFFAAQGGLEPLDHYLAQSELIHESDFFTPTIGAFRFEGRLWCIPQNVSSLVVYYNRDLFDAAGVEYPTEGWNWNDFVSRARALTRDTDGDGQIDQYGVGLSPNLFRLAPFIWQNGGELVDDPLRPTRLALDSPAALEALRWFVGLQVQEGVAPDLVAETAEDSESRFLNGRLAMFLNSRRGVPTYRTITAFEWDVAPLPRGRQAAGILHSDGYCMAAAAPNKAAAWAFIEFANSPQGQELMASTGRTVPSLVRVANSPAFLDPNLPPANSRVFIDTVPLLRAVPIMANWPAIEETAGRQIEMAFYGQIPAEEAAASAIELTRPYFAPPR